MTGPILALAGASRSFGPVQVLFDVDFDLRAGEVHALIGENGAGKSTTMKLLAGYLSPTGGQVMLDGAPTRFADSTAAEDAGIVLIHQEFNLAQQLSVEENIFLGREIRRGPFLDRKAMRAESRALLARLDCDVDPGLLVRDISVPQRQMVEIAKALGRNARVLIMDEPTAVLTNRETDVLLGLIDRLRSEGTAILYTSHKLDEIARVADRVTVLRDGRRVLEAPARDLSEDAMAEAMVGRELSGLFPPRTPPCGGPVLTVTGVTVPGLVEDASFTLRRGEVLGFAGLVGAGRTELMEAVAGLRPRTGRVEVMGVDLAPGTVRGVAERASDTALAPEALTALSSIVAGCPFAKPLAQNLTLLALERFTTRLGGLTIDTEAEDEALSRAIAEFDIRAGDRGMNAGALSGGNQQKLLLAKTMLAEPDIVIIDEPARGIDIGAKQQIYVFISRLAQAGKSVIVVSSELPEVIGLCTRVMVMARGRIVGELEEGAVTEGAILRLAMGLTEKADAT